MLKIKDNVDLKELKKFGFKNIRNYGYTAYRIAYFKKVYLRNDNDDRVCYEIGKDKIIKITRLDGELDNTLYDLIKADLVEKV